MRNEFTAIFERDGDWTIAYCPEIPAPMGKGEPRTKPGQVWLRRSRLFWRTGGQTHAAVFLQKLISTG